MNHEEIADDLAANAAALNVAVQTIGDMPAKSKFLIYGCVMACMAQIDLLSKYEYGLGEPQGGQTARMRRFMERYIDPNKTAEHRVAVQLFRHTLMHTGELRYLYDQADETAYTWRVHFSDRFPAKTSHYTLTPEDHQYQADLLSAVQGTVRTILAFNLNINELAADVQRATESFTARMRSDPALQNACEAAFPEVHVQPLKSPP